MCFLNFDDWKTLLSFVCLKKGICFWLTDHCGFYFKSWLWRVTIFPHCPIWNSHVPSKGWFLSVYCKDTETDLQLMWAFMVSCFFDLKWGHSIVSDYYFCHSNYCQPDQKLVCRMLNWGTLEKCSLLPEPLRPTMVGCKGLLGFEKNFSGKQKCRVEVFSADTL